jgi:hypothetical protein
VGLRRLDVDYDTIQHIPHSDRLRVQNQDVGDVWQETVKNTAAAKAQPWSAADRMTEWNMRREPSGLIVCQEIAGEPPARAGGSGV